MATKAESLFDKGLDLYNKGYYVETSQDLNSIVNALKYFIETNRLLQESDILKPLALYHIALCNYKIGNYKTSYKVANKAIKSIPYIMENGLIQGLSPEILGLKKIKTFITLLETNHYENVKAIELNDSEIDENIINIEKVEKYL